MSEEFVHTLTKLFVLGSVMIFRGIFSFPARRRFFSGSWSSQYLSFPLHEIFIIHLKEVAPNSQSRKSKFAWLQHKCTDDDDGRTVKIDRYGQQQQVGIK